MDNARRSTPASAVPLDAVPVVVVPMPGMWARATVDRKARNGAMEIRQPRHGRAACHSGCGGSESGHDTDHQ